MCLSNLIVHLSDVENLPLRKSNIQTCRNQTKV